METLRGSGKQPQSHGDGTVVADSFGAPTIFFLPAEFQARSASTEPLPGDESSTLTNLASLVGSSTDLAPRKSLAFVRSLQRLS